MSENKRQEWTVEEDQILKENYGRVDPWTLSQLLPNHGRSSTRSRAYYLRNQGDSGIADKQEHRKYDVNFDFFDIIGVGQCAFAGLLASDGCVHPKKEKIQVTSKDTPYLEEWARYVGYTGVVHTYNVPKESKGNGTTSLLLIYGVPKWLYVLKKIFSVTPRKSLTLTPPIISSRENVLAFMLGYIDGDGSIMYKKSLNKQVNKVYSHWCVAFCGTQAMCYWFKAQCDKLYPPKKDYKGVEPNRDTNVWQYRIHGKRAVLLLNDLLEIPVPHLTRKWRKFIDWKEQNNLT